MADAFALARAAAERRKASAPEARSRVQASISGNAGRCSAASVGCAFRRSAPSLVAGSESTLVRGRRQSSDIGCREDDVVRVIASVSEAIQTACAGIWIALGEDSLKVDAVPVTRPGRLAVAKLGRKHAAGTIKGGGDCCQASAKTVARRPSNKCPACPICIGVGTRQTQNVHRSCLHAYARTVIRVCTRRSARVQRGRANFCSIAAGAICGSVTCARSAH